jgi:hypothetical protein
MSFGGIEVEVLRRVLRSEALRRTIAPQDDNDFGLVLGAEKTLAPDGVSYRAIKKADFKSKRKSTQQLNFSNE